MPNCAAFWIPLANFQSLLVGRRLGGASDVVKGLCLPFLCKKNVAQRKSSPFSMVERWILLQPLLSQLLLNKKLQIFHSRSCSTFYNCTQVTDCPFVIFFVYLCRWLAQIRWSTGSILVTCSAQSTLNRITTCKDKICAGKNLLPVLPVARTVFVCYPLAKPGRGCNLSKPHPQQAAKMQWIDDTGA